MNKLYLTPEVRASVEAWAAAGYPDEACGLLIGTPADGAARVRRATRARNLNTERARDRYELHPDDFLAGSLEAEREGLDIVGVWHSHPDHPAKASETDRRQAVAISGGAWSYLIVAVHKGRPVDLKSWRLQGDRFQEETVESWQP